MAKFRGEVGRDVGGGSHIEDDVRTKSGLRVVHSVHGLQSATEGPAFEIGGRGAMPTTKWPASAA